MSMLLDDEAKGPEYSDEVNPGDNLLASDLSIDSPKPNINPDSSSAPAIGHSGAISIADREMLVRQPPAWCRSPEQCGSS